MARDDGFGPAQISTSGQSPSGLSAEHLARLHELASRAKQWDLAAVLAVALDAATRAEAPNVASLDEARRRRRDGQ